MFITLSKLLKFTVLIFPESIASGLSVESLNKIALKSNMYDSSLNDPLSDITQLEFIYSCK